jgi:hypothetical protein
MAEKGEVLDAIMRYGFNSDEYTGDSTLVAMIFDLMKPYIDENKKRYDAIVERNRVNGKRGGRPKSNKNPEKPRETQQNPVGYFGNPEKPSRTQTNLDTDTDTDTDTVPTVSNTSRTDVLEDAEIVDIETEISGKNSKRVRATKNPEKPKEVTWRDSFDVYLQDCRAAWKRWMNDGEWVEERRRFNPGVDIRLTLEKACKEFWATEAGWLHKKKGRGKTIDWKRIFEYAISQKTNRVYERSKDNSRGKDGLTDDERDQLNRALQSAVNASRMHEIVP